MLTAKMNQPVTIRLRSTFCSRTLYKLPPPTRAHHFMLLAWTIPCIVSCSCSLMVNQIRELVQLKKKERKISCKEFSSRTSFPILLSVWMCKCLYWHRAERGSQGCLSNSRRITAWVPGMLTHIHLPYSRGVEKYPASAKHYGNAHHHPQIAGNMQTGGWLKGLCSFFTKEQGERFKGEFSSAECSC